MKYLRAAGLSGCHVHIIWERLSVFLILSKEMGCMQVSVTESITCLYSCAPNALSATTVFVSLHLFFA